MIYLDYNATTPVDQRVAEEMLPYITTHFGNPSSSHALGRSAKKAVELAREQVSALINCNPADIIFTSGGSESNNTVLKGITWQNKEKKCHIITSAIEHPSVLNVCAWLEKQGHSVTYLPVDNYGLVNPEDLKSAIREDTVLVSIMHANNETGTIQPLKELAGIAHERRVLFHTDAAQSLGKIPVDVLDLGVDFLTVAGHKLYAPKGIGALYISKNTSIEPLIHGAGHENGLRAGTENVIFDVALGKACELAADTNQHQKVKDVTEYFRSELKRIFGDQIVFNGHQENKLPNTLNVSFKTKPGFEILAELDDVAASTGSACHSGTTSLSPVLRAMGVDEKTGLGAIRFSTGRFTIKEEINSVLDKLKQIIK